MTQNKSVEEVVRELRTWACNYHGEFFKRYSSDSEEKKKLWFTVDEVEKIIEHTVQQERQTSQEREREIVLNEVIEIIKSVQLTATKKYADDTTPDKAKIVNDWLMPEVKRNIIEAVKTLTNPNKD